LAPPPQQAQADGRPPPPPLPLAAAAAGKCDSKCDPHPLGSDSAQESSYLLLYQLVQ
jgi:hypothetical protein